VSIWDGAVRRGGEPSTSDDTNQERPMRYVLLICTDETADAARSPEEVEAGTAAYTAFQKEHDDVIQEVVRLRPTTTATTVRVRDGEVLTSDGPFAETKEQLGGHYVVDCKDLDEAIQLAARIPGAHRGVVEVRPVWEPGER
jgi:hypothetical protein